MILIAQGRTGPGWGLVVLCALGVVACDARQEPASPQPSASTVTTEPSRSDSTVSTTSSTGVQSIGITGVYEQINFYPACGNEILTHQGVTWYPIVHVGFEPMNRSLQVRVDEVLGVRRDRMPRTDGFARVAPPGPGDDVGTLVVWADGVARWVSDSGELDVWMVDDEVIYAWEC